MVLGVASCFKNEGQIWDADKISPICRYITQICSSAITRYHLQKIFFLLYRDVDFNLDGDFGKLSSFKVDMPDFDLSCSPKKAAKLKERSEGKSSGGNHQGKKDQINFSFDFNE